MANPSQSPAVTAAMERLTEKAELINRVLSEPEVDLWKLRELALSDGGLVNGEFPMSCQNVQWMPQGLVVVS